tara:strand:- start:606 stop:1496 length:891 start_codon:yes stop_codon:yes gene_type:complete
MTGKKQRRLIRAFSVRTAKVRCLGRYHEIHVMGNGRLRLLHHDKEEVASMRTMQSMGESADVATCRCFQVLQWWRLLFTPSFDWREDSELRLCPSSAWFQKAMTVKARADKGEYQRDASTAALLEQLPSQLRTWAAAQHKLTQGRPLFPRPAEKAGRWAKRDSWDNEGRDYEKRERLRALMIRKYEALGVDASELHVWRMMEARNQGIPCPAFDPEGNPLILVQAGHSILTVPGLKIRSYGFRYPRSGPEVRENKWAQPIAVLQINGVLVRSEDAASFFSLPEGTPPFITPARNKS